MKNLYLMAAALTMLSCSEDDSQNVQSTECDCLKVVEVNNFTTQGSQEFPAPNWHAQSSAEYSQDCNDDGKIVYHSLNSSGQGNSNSTVYWTEVRHIVKCN